jgi:LysR family transcriptional regulator, transcriptional activator of nhaA
MDWLNYHHLHYFWLVVREGSISAAAEQLHLARPTVSSQLQQLEKTLGDKLFKRVGRNLVPTEFGQLVFRYADEIFTVGRELGQVVRGSPPSRPARFFVGMPDSMPKLIAYQLIKPAFQLPEPVHVVCREGTLSDLLAELAVHRLDVVVADAPMNPAVNIRAYNHFLGECEVSLYGRADLAEKYHRRFPNSLKGAPLLLPVGTSPMRRALDQWFDEQRIQPLIVGEFEDTALMKVFGQEGQGLFPAPAAIEREVCRQYQVRVVGRAEKVRERFYAISVDRRLKHPAAVAICQAARAELFA